MIVELLGDVAAHAEHVDAWWRDQRPDAPDLFRNELSGALQLLSEAPHVGPLYRARAADDVRRLLLRDRRSIGSSVECPPVRARNARSRAGNPLTSTPAD